MVPESRQPGNTGSNRSQPQSLDPSDPAEELVGIHHSTPLRLQFEHPHRSTTTPDQQPLDVADAPEGFHARYSAIHKRYRYRISHGKVALERNRVWTLFLPVDEEPMIEASQHLIGDHCFGAFCKQDPVPDSTACQIRHCRWERSGRELVFEIEANRFLRHMVRILIGTLVEVGWGRRHPDRKSVV